MCTCQRFSKAARNRSDAVLTWLWLWWRWLLRVMIAMMMMMMANMMMTEFLLEKTSSTLCGTFYPGGAVGRFQKHRLAGKPISNQLNQYTRTLTSPSSSFFFSGAEKLLSEDRSSCKIIFNIHPFQFSQQLVLLFWTFCFPFKLHLSNWWKRFSCTSITALIHLRDTNMDMILASPEGHWRRWPPYPCLREGSIRVRIVGSLQNGRRGCWGTWGRRSRRRQSRRESPAAFSHLDLAVPESHFPSPTFVFISKMRVT